MRQSFLVLTQQKVPLIAQMYFQFQNKNPKIHFRPIYLERYLEEN